MSRVNIGKAHIDGDLLRFSVSRTKRDGQIELFYKGYYRKKGKRSIFLYKSINKNGTSNEVLSPIDAKNHNNIKKQGIKTFEEFMLPVTFNEKSREAICKYYGFDKKYEIIFREVWDMLQTFKAIKAFDKLVNEESENFDKLLEFEPKLTDVFYEKYESCGGSLNEPSLEMVDLIVEELRKQELTDLNRRNAFIALRNYHEGMPKVNIKNYISIVGYLKNISQSTIEWRVFAIFGSSNYGKNYDSTMLSQFVSFWKNSKKHLNIDPDSNAEFFLSAYERQRFKIINDATTKLLDENPDMDYREAIKIVTNMKLNFSETLFKKYFVNLAIGNI